MEATSHMLHNVKGGEAFLLNLRWPPPSHTILPANVMTLLVGEKIITAEGEPPMICGVGGSQTWQFIGQA